MSRGFRQHLILELTSKHFRQDVVNVTQAHLVSVMQSLFGTTAGLINNVPTSQSCYQTAVSLAEITRRLQPTNLAYKRAASDGSDLAISPIVVFDSPGAITTNSATVPATFSGGTAF